MAKTSMLPEVARRLDGKVALITGGASGIGAFTARLFTRHGARVVIADVQDEIGHSLCSDLGDTATYVHCDVTQEPDVQRAIDFAAGISGSLDIVFSNAGTVGPTPSDRILDSTVENFEHVLRVNLIGCYLTGKHAARVMIPQRAGSIVFTASVASVKPNVAPASYTASKHGVVGLAKSLALELGQYGVRVNCVSPYGVATPLAENAYGMKGKELEEFMADNAVLKGHRLNAEDVAEATLYLAGDEAKYINGLNLFVDGGFTVV